MMWNVLYLVLDLVLLMYYLPTGESKECDKTGINVGRLGKELVFNFPISDLRDKYNKYITEQYGEGVVKNEIPVQDLKKESDIRFKTKTNAAVENTIYRNGNLTERFGNLTKIFMTNDTFVVKITKLHKEDAGIYSIYFRKIRLGQKVLKISDQPKIKGRSRPKPVLKQEDNYTSTIQLECHSVSTSIGDCQLPMSTVWYKNGTRMTDLDPTLSQINVTVDHNGGSFRCLATDYPPCYKKIQTTKHYVDVFNIEECNNVFESETFIVQPEYEPIDVKLDPDQRDITVNKNEDLNVNCSAKCHPLCAMKWEKDYQGIKSSRFITENMILRDLVIENIQKSYEGVYVCLVTNKYGEVKKNFTLSVRETRDNEQNDDMNVYLIVIAFLAVIAAIAIIVVIVLVIMIIRYKRRKKEKMLESIEERKPMMMEEEKENMLESIEERELIKMVEEEKKKIIDCFEKRTSIMINKPKKILKIIDEGQEEKENVLESIEEEELKKMEKEKREMIDDLRRTALKKIEEEKKKIFEILEEGEPMKMEERKKKMIDNLEWNKKDKGKKRKKLESIEMTKLI